MPGCVSSSVSIREGAGAAAEANAGAAGSPGVPGAEGGVVRTGARGGATVCVGGGGAGVTTRGPGNSDASPRPSARRIAGFSFSFCFSPEFPPTFAAVAVFVISVSSSIFFLVCLRTLVCCHLEPAQRDSRSPQVHRSWSIFNIDKYRYIKSTSINVLGCLVHLRSRPDLLGRALFRLLCGPCGQCLRSWWLRGRGGGLPLNNFFRQPNVTLRPSRSRVVHQRRLAMARRLCQFDVSRHSRLAQLLPKEVLQLGHHLLRQVCTLIEHGQHDAFNRQLRVQPSTNPLDCVQQLADTFEREVFCLHGNEDGVGGDERVEGQQIECRRTIQNDELEAITQRHERVAHPVFASFSIDKL